MQEWLEEKEVGKWKIVHYELKEDFCKLENLRMLMHGYGSRRIEPGMYTKLVHVQRGVVMSDTHAELNDLWEYQHALQSFKEYPERSVHIDGLGMGITVKMAVELGYSVEVIEIDPEVIELMKPFIDKLGGDVDIIQADCLTWKSFPNTKYTIAWHDIWDDLCSDNLPEYALLNRRYGQKVRWQGAWGQDFIKQRERSDW